MGEEEQAQQRRVRISPEAREKIREFAKRAGKAAGILVAGGLVGAGIGVGIQYNIMQNTIQRMRGQGPQQCLSQYDLSQGAENAVGKVSKINSILINGLQGEPERMGQALGDVAEITGNIWFKPENLDSLEKITEGSGPNAPLALRMLAALSESGNDTGEIFSEYNAAKVAEAAGLLGSLGGEKAKELLEAVSSSILANQSLGSSAALRLGLAETALRNAASMEEAAWNLGLVSSVVFRGDAQDIQAHVQGIFEAAGKIKGRGGEYSGALEALKEMLTYYPEAYGSTQQEYEQRVAGFRENAKPEGLLEAASYIVDRYADNGRIRVTLGIFLNLLRKGAAPAQKIDGQYAARLCGLTDMAVGESGGNGIYALEFIEKMTANPEFDFGRLDTDLALRAGRMVAGLANRLLGDTGAGMAHIGWMASSSYSQGGRGHMAFQPEQIMDIAEEFSAKMPTAERLLQNLGMVRGMSVTHAERMDRHAAGKLCELENYLYGIPGNGSVFAALDKLEENNFSPAVIGLVGVATRGRHGAQSVIAAIQSLDEALNFGDIPYASMLGRVSHQDVEKADEMLVSMYRVERPPLERLANFSYGISILGPEKARELNKTFGIEYFLRYNEDVLLEVGANADRNAGAGKPILLAVVGKIDWNGVFYSFGSTDLQKLTSHYKLLIAEVGSDSEFMIRINQIAGMYGDISALIVGGHGNPESIALGEYVGPGSLGFSDERSLGMLRDSFVPNPVIILNSCSTGRYDGAIGGMLSRILGAVVYAPTRDSGISNYMLDAGGRITGVDYGVPTRVYENGESRVAGNGQ